MGLGAKRDNTPSFHTIHPAWKKIFQVMISGNTDLVGIRYKYYALPRRARVLSHFFHAHRDPIPVRKAWD